MKRFALLLVALSAFILPPSSFGQTPHLVVSAGTAGQASSLTITSDTAAPWKCFTLSGGSAGQYNVIWAESNGTSGGIFFGTVATSARPDKEASPDLARRRPATICPSAR